MAKPEPRTRRKVEDRAHVAAAALLAGAILLMVNYLGFRHFERFDWTSERLFSVSERTVEVLRALERPIDVYLFMSEGEPNYPDMKELLATYRSHSGKLSVHILDPHRKPSDYRLVAERLGISTYAAEDGAPISDVAVVVSAGERHWKIARDDLFSFNFDRGGAQTVDVEAERALTSAIIEATTGSATEVCVTTGHGEWDLAAGGPRGLGGVRELLSNDNVSLRAVETLGGKAIPKECAALYVIGPERPFPSEEVASIERYLAAGGNVLLALDPIIDGERVAPTGFEAALRRVGVELDPSVVLELSTDRLLSQSPIDAILITDYGKGEVTSHLAQVGVPTVVSLARSVRPLEGHGVEVLLRTTDKGYAELDLAELGADAQLRPSATDIRGPVPLGVVTELEHEGDVGGRLIVLGDADVMTSDFLSQTNLANMDLVSAMTGHLVHRPTLVSISPRTSDAAAVMMTEGDLRSVMIRVLVLLPLAVLLLGLSVFWSRRA